MDATNMFGWDPNAQMTWTQGREIPFTKTPANVPASYTQTQDGEAPTSTKAGKKRKNTANPTTATSSKKRKPTTAPAKRTRRPAARKPASARIIPRSLQECGDADRALISLRDAGQEWKTIRARWEELTGEKTAASTLPNRYSRLKSNFTVIRTEDYEKLLAAKREVEESFEAQKWDLVAKLVGERGGDTYAGVVLRRQYKKLMLSGGVQPPPGIRDADFEVDGEEDEPDADGDGDADVEDEE